MVALLVVRVDNATPIILNCEKSVTLGTLGTLAPWRSTKLSPGMGELCVGAASMRTQEVGSWKSRNGCLIRWPARSEEHTSELQSQSNLVCRLLLEKKKSMKSD